MVYLGIPIQKLSYEIIMQVSYYPGGPALGLQIGYYPPGSVSKTWNHLFLSLNLSHTHDLDLSDL